MDADTGDLTPTEYLMCDVLAARLRLGEPFWTFPTRLRPTARSLADKGYVGWKDGIVEGTVMVHLTLDGEARSLSPNYVLPADR